MPVIAIDDPLLEEFALQHDLRERFFHALEQIQDILRKLDENPEVSGRDVVLASVAVGEIVDEAISPEALRAWGEQGRPLPWLDERLGDGPERLRRAVLLMAGIEDGNMMEDQG